MKGSRLGYKPFHVGYNASKMFSHRGNHRRSTTKVAKFSLQGVDTMKKESYKKGICLAPTTKAQFMNLIVHKGQDSLRLQANYMHILLNCLKSKLAKYTAQDELAQ